MITQKEAIACLPYIDNPMLYKAVSMAMWLILTKGFALKTAITISSKKSDYPVKAHIEKLVRVGIPQEFFDFRQSGMARSKPSVTPLPASVVMAMGKIKEDSKKHMRSITNTRVN